MHSGWGICDSSAFVQNRDLIGSDMDYTCKVQQIFSHVNEYVFMLIRAASSHH